MKNFCEKFLLILLFVTVSFGVSYAQSKPIEEMSVQELRERVIELEKQSTQIKLLKDENKRLRRNLRKARMQLYRSKDSSITIKSSADASVSVKNAENSKENLQKENPDKEPETLWEWITQ